MYKPTVQSNSVEDVTLNDCCFNRLIQKYDATRAKFNPQKVSKTCPIVQCKVMPTYAFVTIAAYPQENSSTEANVCC